MDRAGRLQRAFDTLRFGATRTLNVRDAMPSGETAASRVDAWLRSKQVEGAGEALVITGRGAGSPGGVGVVRRAVERRLALLRRQGVVADASPHGPGAFVVRLASLRSLLEAPRHDTGGASVAGRDIAIEGLEPATLEALRRLAGRVLDALGVDSTEGPLLRAEVERQFSLLVRASPGSHATDEWLRAAAERAIREFDDAPTAR